MKLKLISGVGAEIAQFTEHSGMGRAAESFSVLIRNHIIKKNPVKTPYPRLVKITFNGPALRMRLPLASLYIAVPSSPRAN